MQTSLSVATSVKSLVAYPRKPLPINTTKCIAGSDGAGVRSSLKIVIPIVIGRGLSVQVWGAVGGWRVAFPLLGEFAVRDAVMRQKRGLSCGDPAQGCAGPTLCGFTVGDVGSGMCFKLADG